MPEQLELKNSNGDAMVLVTYDSEKIVTRVEVYNDFFDRWFDVPDTDENEFEWVCAQRAVSEIEEVEPDPMTLAKAQMEEELCRQI